MAIFSKWIKGYGTMQTHSNKWYDCIFMDVQQIWKNGIFSKNGHFFQKFFGNFIGSKPKVIPGVENMGRVQTSVMIDEDKRALAKQRGIKLQDLLDEALNMVLELEIPGKAQLEIEKENIIREIEIKEKQKDDYLKNYNNELERLEIQKNEFLATHDNAINELNLKLQFNEKALAGASEEQKALNQLNEYKEIILKAKQKGYIEAYEEELQDHCIKYKLADINGVFDQAKRDINSLFSNELTIDDITLDYDIFKPYKGADE